MAAANTYSLFMIFLFMSNGLIALPRSMFNHITIDYRFRYLVCKYYYYSKHLDDHQFNLEVAISVHFIRMQYLQTKTRLQNSKNILPKLSRK